MGGCVSTIMNQRNAGSVQSHKIISGEYRPYGVEAVPVEGTEQDNSSPIYRISNTTDAQHRKDTHDYYHGENWPHVVRSRCSETPDEPAFGYRIIERVEKRVTVDSKGREKTLEFYHCSSYKTISYAEVWTTLTALGRGFRALGLGDNANISIYEDTRWEWMVTMYGIWSQNMVSSTVYANLGEDALAYALGETNSEAIVCNGRTLTQLVQLLDTNDLHPIIIYLDDLPAGFDAGSHRVVSWKDVVARGNAPEVVEQYPIQMPTDNDAIALIMYTSGTTGDPKGVMHSHGSVAAGIRALNHRLIDLYRPNEDGGREIYCAYLPLAHILEFALTNIFVSRGTLVGFGNPRTLTDNFAIPHGDLREYKPRFIIAVPRIFDTIKKAVEAKLPPPGSFKRQIFDKAYQSRLDALQAGQETPYWNEKVFSAARAVLGGNIYGMLSGGGPLSSSTQEFINVVCGGPLLIQGWGLTETVCCGTTQRIGDLEPQCAGQLLISAEMRLFDTEEYKHTDSPEPRGEICLRGPFLFKGYYRQPELTAQALDSEGWFHTGDIGAITPEGKVRIVGRIKALAKNCLGEYIALETLEAVYSQCALSAVNGVCVLVHPDRPFIGALILTDEGRAMTFAKEHKIAGDYPEILSHPDFLAAAAAAFAATAKKAGRQSFELVKKVRVLDDLWTPENGLVTPTMKLRRTKVEEHYRALIEDIFQE